MANYNRAKDIIKGSKAREKMVMGIDALADAVKVTLGPKGRNVAIEQPYYGPAKVTKDGVTVAKSIDLKCKQENVGAQLVKSVASKTADVAGDGTTTATILTQAIVKEGNKSVVAGFNPMDLKRGIDLAVSKIVDSVKKASKKISSQEEIAQVGTISANGDKEVGEKIALAMEKVGKDGVITVEESRNFDFEVDVAEGMKIDRGFISPHFVTNPEKMICELDNPMILLFSNKISSLKPLVPLLEFIIDSGQSLLIIAEDIEGEALATLVLNKLHSKIKTAAIKSPGFGDKRKELMEDIALLTGGRVITDEIGTKLDNVNPEMLGSARKVTISKDETIFVDGAGNKSDIEARCSQLRQDIQDNNFILGDDSLHKRLAKLSGGVAILKVGGATEVEVKERKDRVDDALHATRAAVEEGVVAGGGTTLFYAAKELENLKGENDDQQAGINIVKNALQAPLRQIAENAGIDGAIVVGKLQESKSISFGFNAQTMEYVDMIKGGIIDPTKVVRTALQDAASVASLIITTEIIITDELKESSNGGV